MRDGERKKEKKTEKIKWKYKERENRNILKKAINGQKSQMEDDKRKEIKIGRNGDEKQNKQKQNNQRK